MLLKRIFVILGLLLFLASPITASEDKWPVIHGDILEVDEAQGRVRLRTGEGMVILQLQPSCEILRRGQPITLGALHPITSVDFQDGLFFVDLDGSVSHIFVNYAVQERHNHLISYDIFGNVKRVLPLQ